MQIPKYSYGNDKKCIKLSDETKKKKNLEDTKNQTQNTEWSFNFYATTNRRQRKTILTEVQFLYFERCNFYDIRRNLTLNAHKENYQSTVDIR